MFTIIRVQPNAALRKLVPSITPAGQVFYFDPATSRGSKPVYWMGEGTFEVLGTADNFMDACGLGWKVEPEPYDMKGDLHIVSPGFTTVSRFAPLNTPSAKEAHA